jgi:hypothetical protein
VEHGLACLFHSVSLQNEDGHTLPLIQLESAALNPSGPEPEAEPEEGLAVGQSSIYKTGLRKLIHQLKARVRNRDSKHVDASERAKKLAGAIAGCIEEGRPDRNPQSASGNGSVRL